MPHDLDRYGPNALVTGAAMGLGEAFADEIADRGLGVVAVDREEHHLAGVAERLRARGVPVTEAIVDLATPTAADELVALCERHDVGLFVHCAITSYVGRFAEQPLDNARSQLAVNCELPMVVTRHLVERYLAAGRGGILLVGSMSGLHGTPITAAYAATKAWTVVFAESVWAEVAGRGVDVCAVVPGTIDTPGLRSSQPADTSSVPPMAARDVAVEALDALGTTPCVIPGDGPRASAAFLASIDRRDAVVLTAEVMNGLYPAHANPVPGPATP